MRKTGAASRSIQNLTQAPIRVKRRSKAATIATACSLLNLNVLTHIQESVVIYLSAPLDGLIGYKNPKFPQLPE